jgi:F0F1-type ATP synthase assembly protein I
MTAWQLSGFALAAIVGYVARRLIERYQEEQRERAVMALGDMGRRRRRRKSIEEKRAIWLLGAMTGWSVSAYLHTHEWEAVAWALLGLYGLLDVRRMNLQLVRRRSR